jgi:hypothetical protein
VRRTLVAMVGLLVGAAGLFDPAIAAEDDRADGQVRRAVFVGNNWAGTADILAPGSFERLGRINVVPDRDERIQEIATDPYRFAYFLAIRALIGEGHDHTSSTSSTPPTTASR